MIKDTDIKVIGLCGVAQSGKDTFCKHAIKLFADQNIKCMRVSFADALKADVDDFLIDKVGISAFTTKLEEKTLIRDFLVAYGTKLMRKIDEGCWINKAEILIKENINNNVLSIITDIRYPNELKWVQKTLKGKCLHISRVNKGAYIEPANREEAEHDPILLKLADSNLNWATLDDEDTLEWIVGDELNSLLQLTEAVL